jgi:1-acyl-sn-glycerol-3-phosphate acyltransferase
LRLRAARRTVALVSLLVYCFARSFALRIFRPDTLERRAQWLHESALLVMQSMDIDLQINGTPPVRGLLVANHLSYLDIMIFGAALPCYLVSKAEISRWPLFGPLARSGGTIFVDRSSRASAEQVTEEIAERLKGSVPVLFFPEGTSTDGTLLPFHSRFYVPAVNAGLPITAAAVRYIPEDGSAERELCWFGDAGFLPHLFRVLGGPGFSAQIDFGQPHLYPDRRSAVAATHSEIAAMRQTRARVEP